MSSNTCSVIRLCKIYRQLRAVKGPVALAFFSAGQWSLVLRAQVGVCAPARKAATRRHLCGLVETRARRPPSEHEGRSLLTPLNPSWQRPNNVRGGGRLSFSSPPEFIFLSPLPQSFLRQHHLPPVLCSPSSLDARMRMGMIMRLYERQGWD